MKNKKLHFTCIFITLFVFPELIAQKVSTNEQGDTIVTFVDGSWRFFMPSDTIFQQIRVLGPQIAQKPKRKEKKKKSKLPKPRPFEKKVVAAQLLNNYQLSKKTGQDTIDIGHKIDAYFNQQKIVLQNYKDDLKKLIDLKRIVEKEINTTTAKTESYDNLKDQIKELSKQQKMLTKQILKQEKKVAKTEQLTRANNKYQQKWVVKYERKNGPIREASNLVTRDQVAEEPVQEPVTNRQTPEVDKKSDQVVDATGTKYSPIPTMPPNYGYNDCEIAYIGNDNFSNKRRIDVAKRILFEYTHEELRPYFKDKVYMVCEGFLSAQPGFKYLTLQFTVASDRAKQSFGALQKGSILTIKLIDDTYINLINKSDDFGTVNLQNKTTTYSGQYVIDKKQEKELLVKEIDQIRVSWTSGYEDYEIYELDFFKNQFKCLNNAY